MCKLSIVVWRCARIFIAEDASLRPRRLMPTRISRRACAEGPTMYRFQTGVRRVKIDEPDHAGSYPTGMSDIAFRAPEMLCACFIACFYNEL